ncbi:MAG: DDE-type integrase/transposase/recombinase [Bacteroidales bacterium]|nr:DDE-type integrase/transposase/recombinase [Bacteroidales bacterium]
MKKYNSYHTSIKQLAKRNNLPKKYASSIDRSTIWRWRKEEDDKYFGAELSKIDLLEHFLERRESATVIRAYLKFAATFSVILRRSSQFQKTLSENKEKFVHSILRYRKNINLKLVLRLCNISSSVFYHWRNQVLKKCPSSPIQLCRRFYSNQLTKDEANRMKKLLSSQQFRYWPVNSIAYYALRNNIVNVSLATWYNYIKKLGWDRPRAPKKPKYETGIRANRPHQVWHADITVVKCLNGMKYYVYLLMDNFSRFILNYQVSEKVSAVIRMQSIRQAYDQYIKDSGEDVRLIVDGGVENNNYTVDNYISSEEVSVQKLIAGKDIRFSNSMVEAQNKIIKYRYLFKHDFKDIHELRNLLDWIIPDYQYERPHHSLKGLTPYEVLTGIPLPTEQWQQQIQEARQLRVQQNMKETCEIC